VSEKTEPVLLDPGRVVYPDKKSAEEAVRKLGEETLRRLNGGGVVCYREGDSQAPSAAPAKPKLSGPMKAVLTNLARGLPAAHHCRTSGLAGTIAALVRRGLVTHEHELTEKGREALKEKA
jgi:hypothetical protein